MSPSSSFDPAKDVKMALETNFVLPKAMRDLHKAGDIDEFNRLKSVEKADLEKLMNELHLHPEEHAWTTIKLKDGSSMKVFFKDGVGTMYSRVVPDETSHTDATTPSPTGKNGGTAQLGMYSATTKSGTLVTWKFHNLTDTTGWKAFELGLGFAVAGIFYKLTQAFVRGALEKGVVWISETLLARGLIGEGAQLWIAEVAAGRLVAFSSGLLCSAVGGLIGFGIGLAITALIKYATTDYFLTVVVYNFETDRTWSVVEQGGRNVQVLEGIFPGAIRPMQKPHGVLPPGFMEDQPAQNAIVNYRTYYLKNNLTVAGGFTVGFLMTSDDDLSFDFAYRVEKMHDNSMHLRRSGMSPASYVDSIDNVISASLGQMVARKELVVEEPVHVRLASPELFNAPKDDYKLDVYIGVEPQGEWSVNSEKDT